MKKGKGIFNRLLGGFLVALLAFSVFPAQALAYVLDVNNPYSDKMAVAVVDYEDQAETWRCHGWFEVAPTSTRRLTINSSTARNHIYLFVKTSEAKWSGEGYKSSVARTVISNAFNYYDGQACPAGNNRRQEYFAKYELEDGYMYWSP